jgi:conjugal transfer mating pair stabilization protein TraG
MTGACSTNTAQGHSVIDSNAAISQLPFKASMTRGYATDLRNAGPVVHQRGRQDRERHIDELDQFARNIRQRCYAATSDVSGSRRESGSRSSDTHNVGGNVMVEGSIGQVDARSHEQRSDPAAGQ